MADFLHTGAYRVRGQILRPSASILRVSAVGTRRRVRLRRPCPHGMLEISVEDRDTMGLDSQAPFSKLIDIES